MKAFGMIAFVCLTSPIALSATAQGPQTSPTKPPMTTISGTVGKVADNRFMIDTDSGPMLITTGPKGHHRLELKSGEKITVTGEAGALDFDAFEIKRADGQTIEIRPAEGPPPWVKANWRGQGKGPPPWAGRGEDGRDGGPPPWAGRGGDRDGRGPPPWAGRGDDRDERSNRGGPPPWAGPRR